MQVQHEESYRVDQQTSQLNGNSHSALNAQKLANKASMNGGSESIKSGDMSCKNIEKINMLQPDSSFSHVAQNTDNDEFKPAKDFIEPKSKQIFHVETKRLPNDGKSSAKGKDQTAVRSKQGKQADLVLKPEHKDHLLLLIADLRKDPNSYPFLEPVNWKELGLLNYPLIIQKPMDLSTVKKNVVNMHYSSMKDFTNDLQ